MNKVLFKAAVILNIAAASLIYVACSGDDGDRGPAGADGAGCTAVPSTVSPGNGFDISCGGTYYGTVLNGSATDKGDKGDPGPAGPAGPKGDGCRGDLTSDGNGIAITCGTELVGVITGGGISVEGGCITNPLMLNNDIDKGIKITCATTGTTATILVCSKGTALHVDEQGQVGYCSAAGYVSRTGEVATLSCGGATFDPRRQFCQNTFTLGDTAGLFAVLNTYGTTERLEVGGYPANYAQITSPTSPYNKATGKAGVKSVVLPLCGVEPAASNASESTIGGKHAYVLEAGSDNYSPVIAPTNKNTVYNGKQFCGRNIVIKSSQYRPGTTTPLAGGLLDLDANNPTSSAWSVLAENTCIANLNAAGESASNINGFKFVTDVTQNDADRRTRGCSFFLASSSPYTACPSDKPVLAIDNVQCVARNDCIYHSVIDNTCLVNEGEKPSLYGGSEDNKLIATAYEVTPITNPATYAFSATREDNNPNKGITATKVGNRFGSANLLDKTGNLWSKACISGQTGTTTVKRTTYYAVNDPYLTNKPFKDANVNQPAAVYATTTQKIEVESPICEDLTPVTGTNPPVITQAAVSFEQAFACLKGTLSLDRPNGNDGSTWDKPIYCVLDGYTSDKYCAVSGTGITSSTCGLGNGKLADPLKSSSVLSASTTINFSYGDGVCKVTGAAVGGTTTATEGTQAECQKMNGVSLSESDPIPVQGTIYGYWHSSQNVCEVYNARGPVGTIPGSGTALGSDGTEAIGDYDLITNPDVQNCESIDKLWYGNKNPVLGNITAEWITISANAVPGKCDYGTATSPNSVTSTDDNCPDVSNWTDGDAGTCTSVPASTLVDGALATATNANCTNGGTWTNGLPGTCSNGGTPVNGALATATNDNCTNGDTWTNGLAGTCTSVSASTLVNGALATATNANCTNGGTWANGLAGTCSNGGTPVNGALATATNANCTPATNHWTNGTPAGSRDVCRVTSSHSSALQKEDNCSQITEAAMESWKKTPIGDATFYWVQ